VANIKSSQKRARTSLIRAQRNAARKSRVRTAVRHVKLTLVKDPTAAAAAFREASGVLDRAASQGTIHRNAANRRKSRLAKRIAAAEVAGKRV
jgi:small subunit ribosomal protein S20